MRLATIACLLLLALPRVGLSASPQDRKRAAALIKDGEQQYQAGKYREAAETLKQAQQLDPNPRLIYNIARAYDQAGDLPAALQSYQQYIGSPEGTDPTLLKRASLAVDRLRSLIAQQDEERARLEAEKKHLEQEKSAAEQHAQQETASKLAASAEVERHKREQTLSDQTSWDKSRMFSYVAGGVGVVALGSGGYFGWQAMAAKNSMGGALTLVDKTGFASRAQSNALIADVSFGVSAAALVAAFVLWPKHDRPELSPIKPGPGGASIELSF